MYVMLRFNYSYMCKDVFTSLQLLNFHILEVEYKVVANYSSQDRLIDLLNVSVRSRRRDM